MFSLITASSAIPASTMPVNTHFNTHNFSETSTYYQTTNEFSKKYSENGFLKNLKPMSYSYGVQSMNFHRKSIEWFLF